MRSSKAVAAMLIVVFNVSVLAAQTRQSGVYPGSSKAGSPPQQFTQSTIEGCLVGRGGDWALTDIHDGTTYLLQGNNEMLAANNGKQVSITGAASPTTPSKRKGQPGYINPSAPGSGDTGTQGSARTFNFNVQLIQAVASRCQGGTAISNQSATARSEAALAQLGKGTAGTVPQVGPPATASEANNISGCLSRDESSFTVLDQGRQTNYTLTGITGQLANHVHHIVRLQGHVDMRSSEGPAGQVFHVDQVQDSGETCVPGASHTSDVPVTGKEGNKGSGENVSSTAAASRPTPGIQTEAGREQLPGATAAPHTQPKYPNTAPNAKEPGHPPNWEGVGNSRGEAENIARNAEKTEIGAPQGTLGVGGKGPEYSQNEKISSSTSQRSTTTGQSAAVAARQGGNDSRNAAGASSNRVKSAEGCLNRAAGRFKLEAKGQTYELAGNISGLQDLLGHTVRVRGNVHGSSFQVRSIEDVSADCRAR